MWTNEEFHAILQNFKATINEQIIRYIERLYVIDNITISFFKFDLIQFQIMDYRINYSTKWRLYKSIFYKVNFNLVEFTDIRLDSCLFYKLFSSKSGSLDKNRYYSCSWKNNKVFITSKYDGQIWFPGECFYDKLLFKQYSSDAYGKDYKSFIVYDLFDLKSLDENYFNFRFYLVKYT